MASHSMKKKKKMGVMTRVTAALAAVPMVAAGLFLMAPAANAADAPVTPTAAVATTDAPATQDTAPAPAAAPAADTAPAATSTGPAAPTPEPAPAAAPEPATPAGSDTPTGPTTTAGPTDTAAAPAAAATPVTTSDTTSDTSATATQPATKVATQAKTLTTQPATNNGGHQTEKKVFVCKYVGTPGVDERLQTGQNPISVSVNAIQHNQWNGTVPGYFSDAHNRSYVLAYDNGQPKPDVSTCPAPVGPPVTEKKEAVGLYLYKALDATKAPSWENAGDQIFCGSKDGHDWFNTLPCTLPTEVCGPGWDIQQDKVKDWAYEGAFKWPSTIKSGVDNIGWPPIYDAKHQRLSDLITVPDCAPPKEHVSGNVTFTDTVCYANQPVSNGAVVTLNGKTTATYTLNGGEAKALPAGTIDDSIIGLSGYPAVLHVVLTGEDGSTLAFDHTFVAPKSSSDCAPPVTGYTPAGPVFSESTTCGVPGGYTIPGVGAADDSYTVTDPNTGDITTYSEFNNSHGGYFVTDVTTKDGVHTVQILFLQSGSAPIAEPGPDDTYTIVTIDGIRFAQWTHTFTQVESCPVITIIPTPPAPTVIAPTCTAAGSLPPLKDGDGYTAAYDRPFDGPGKYTVTYTVTGDNTSFKNGKTVSYDLTVLGKLTENCSTSTPTPTPTHTTTPATTTSSNNGNGGANTGLDGREPGTTASSMNTVNPVVLWSGVGLLVLALFAGAVYLIRRQRNQGGVEAQ